MSELDGNEPPQAERRKVILRKEQGAVEAETANRPGGSLLQVALHRHQLTQALLAQERSRRAEMVERQEIATPLLSGQHDLRAGALVQAQSPYAALKGFHSRVKRVLQGTPRVHLDQYRVHVRLCQAGIVLEFGGEGVAYDSQRWRLVAAARGRPEPHGSL